MRIAVRYHSRGGNTKTVAKAIARAADVIAEPIDVLLDAPVDLLFIGGGVYGGAIKGDIDSAMRQYLEILDPNAVKNVAAFSTAGVMDGAKRIAAIVRSKGIPVHEKTLPLKVGPRNHRTFVKEGHLTLSGKELAAIDAFVKKVLAI